MNSLVLLLIGIVLFLVAYTFYGGYVAKQWGIDPNRKTPAYTLRDDVDYCPANAKVLLGHHFSSIAGAGPITGPIQAAIFGWVPVYLWIVIGSMFIGGIHDWGALFSSVRHEGKSIGEIIRVEYRERQAKSYSTTSHMLTAGYWLLQHYAHICAALRWIPQPERAYGRKSRQPQSTLIIFLAMALATFYRKGANP